MGGILIQTTTGDLHVEHALLVDPLCELSVVLFKDNILESASNSLSIIKQVYSSYHSACSERQPLPI